MSKRKKASSKIERTEEKNRLVEYHQHGRGLFLFRNRSSVASLELPKISSDGKKWIQPGHTWQGDSYFFSLVPREATLVETLVDPNKETKMEEKLILDQPDQVTNSGKVEHKVKPDLPINEVGPTEQSEEEKLLTEDPLAGVTIIRD
jgi:hypothetical protein